MSSSPAKSARLLAYLALRSPQAQPRTSCEVHADPYYGAGCHPDVVQRLWDQIGKTLPRDCRCLLYGTPALAHPATGNVLAVGIGTQYALRLPPGKKSDALAAGARTTTRWTTGGEMDVQAEFGSDWVFGTWQHAELEWCTQAYEAEQRAARRLTANRERHRKDTQC